jgi:hypothetical protein
MADGHWKEGQIDVEGFRDPAIDVSVKEAAENALDNEEFGKGKRHLPSTEVTRRQPIIGNHMTRLKLLLFSPHPVHAYSKSSARSTYSWIRSFVAEKQRIYG